MYDFINDFDVEYIESDEYKTIHNADTSKLIKELMGRDKIITAIAEPYSGLQLRVCDPAIVLIIKD